jgi:hypothetical protein
MSESSYGPELHNRTRMVISEKTRSKILLLCYDSACVLCQCVVTSGRRPGLDPGICRFEAGRTDIAH